VVNKRKIYKGLVYNDTIEIRGDLMNTFEMLNVILNASPYKAEKEHNEQIEQANKSLRDAEKSEKYLGETVRRLTGYIEAAKQSKTFDASDDYFLRGKMGGEDIYYKPIHERNGTPDEYPSDYFLEHIAEQFENYKTSFEIAQQKVIELKQADGPKAPDFKKLKDEYDQTISEFNKKFDGVVNVTLVKQKFNEVPACPLIYLTEDASTLRGDMQTFVESNIDELDVEAVHPTEGEVAPVLNVFPKQGMGTGWIDFFRSDQVYIDPKKIPKGVVMSASSLDQDSFMTRILSSYLDSKLS